MKYNCLFYTFADTKYEMFVVPYIYFVLRNNPSALVEICLEDEAGFVHRSQAALKVLESIYPDRFALTQAKAVHDCPDILPNTVRFIERPTREAEYLYVGDIDLLVFEDVVQRHTSLMAKHGLPFSNIVRPESVDTAHPRLSGLHFCKFEDYFPLPDLSDLNLATSNDEFVLYEIMRRKGMMVPSSFQVRPECGIHLSMNRDPSGRTRAVSGVYSADRATGWSGSEYHQTFLQQIKESAFQSLFPLLDLPLRLLLLTVEALATDRMRELHRMAASYMLDKRLVLPFSAAKKSDLLAEREAAFSERDFERAKQIGCYLNLIWPNDRILWFKQAYLLLSLREVDAAVEVLLHIADTPEGREFLLANKLVSDNSELIRGSGKRGHRLLSVLERQ